MLGLFISILDMCYKKDFEICLKKISKKISTSRSEDKLSIFNGALSKALYLSSLSRLYPEDKEKNNLIINDYVTEAFEYIENNNIPLNNLFGLVNFGYGISSLSQSEVLAVNLQETFNGLDQHIFKLNINYLDNNNYDFFYGALGCANYFLNRAQSTNEVDDKLNTIGLKLIEVSKKNESFYRWKKKTSNENEIDLSISHGLSSILMFISRLIELNISPDYFKPIAKNICSQILYYENNNRIPDSISKSETNFSPLRWCHGELGIVSALAYSSKVLNDKEINMRAFSIATKISKFKLIDNHDINSAIICHGTLGIAHVFNKWFNCYWKSNEIKDAVHYWYNESNKILNSKIQFKNCVTKNKYEEEIGILTGVEGIGLALISAINYEISDWEKSILLY
ncbi:MAG: hypothetical protein COB15_02825 [Flavobacteriales bacterium]|nr:MAG: hypothetical protein COB15_02825 [Flavobacteriales bacterium]